MSQEIQWLKIWEKFQIQDVLDNTTKLEALRKSNQELVNWLKVRSENELKLYAKWILEQKISYANNSYFPELKWKTIDDELINQEVARIKDRVKNSWAKNMDNMWYLLVTFLEKIQQIKVKKEEDKVKIVTETKEIKQEFKQETNEVEKETKDTLNEAEVEALKSVNEQVTNDQLSTIYAPIERNGR